MMPVTLTLRDRRRQVREVAVQTSRFTIGSAAENDLVLEGLAERQAIIECFENVVEATDLSADGMRVNGHLRTGTVRLRDGDVLSLGETCELIVHLAEQNVGSSTIPAPPTHNQPVTAKQFSAPLLALAVLILTVAGLVLFLPVNSNLRIVPTPTPAQTSPPSTPASTPAVSSDNQQLQKILASAGRTVKCISNDEHGYIFPEEVKSLLKDRVAFYKQQPETVSAALQAVARQRTPLLAQAQKIVPEHPGLVLYLVFAELVTSQADNPLTVASRLEATLPERRIDIGVDAQSTLILVAGQQLNKAQWKDFNGKRGKAISDSIQQRNVWWFYKLRLITADNYQFVLDFLALSVIAQDPETWLGQDLPKIECVA